MKELKKFYEINRTTHKTLTQATPYLLIYGVKVTAPLKQQKRSWKPLMRKIRSANRLSNAFNKNLDCGLSKLVTWYLL